MNKNCYLSKERYLFLLQESQILKQKGESLSDLDQKELANYEDFLAMQISYNSRVQYLSLLEDYLEEKIGLYYFYSSVNNLFWEQDRTCSNLQCDLEKLSNLTMEFEIYSKMTKFALLIHDIWLRYDDSDLEELYWAESNINYKPEIDFKPAFKEISNFIQQKYQQIKKCLEE